MELRRRGVLALHVCTEAFEAQARAQANDLDCPDLAIVAVPHPIGGIGEAVVRERARVAVEKIGSLIGEGAGRQP